MRKAAVLVFAALAALAAFTGCGRGETDRPAAARSEEPPAPAQPAASDESEISEEELRVAALSLVPPGATLRDEGELRKRTCPVGDTGERAPCVEFSVTTTGTSEEQRIRLFGDQARAEGWRVVGFNDVPTRAPGSGGASYELEQGELRATVGIAPDSGTDACPTCTTNFPIVTRISVSVPGQAAPLVEPVKIESAAGGPEKRAFVERANSICRAMDKRMQAIAMPPGKEIEAIGRAATIWNEGLTQIAALEPPPGDEKAVAALVLEFRRFGQALRWLLTAKGEDALPASVGLIEQAKRVDDAAWQYGLEECSTPR